MGNNDTHAAFKPHQDNSCHILLSGQDQNMHTKQNNGPQVASRLMREGLASRPMSGLVGLARLAGGAARMPPELPTLHGLHIGLCFPDRSQHACCIRITEWISFVSLWSLLSRCPCSKGFSDWGIQPSLVYFALCSKLAHQHYTGQDSATGMHHIVASASRMLSPTKHDACEFPTCSYVV